MSSNYRHGMAATLSGRRYPSPARRTAGSSAARREARPGLPRGKLASRGRLALGRKRLVCQSRPQSIAPFRRPCDETHKENAQDNDECVGCNMAAINESEDLPAQAEKRKGAEHIE